MSEAEEQATRNALLDAKGEAVAFKLIQALANGTQKDTVTILTNRYPSETERNKAEIALTVARIAKHNASVLPATRAFLTASIANEVSSPLQHALKQCLHYLDQE